MPRLFAEVCVFVLISFHPPVRYNITREGKGYHMLPRRMKTAKGCSGGGLPDSEESGGKHRLNLLGNSTPTLVILYFRWPNCVITISIALYCLKCIQVI